MTALQNSAFTASVQQHIFTKHWNKREAEGIINSVTSEISRFVG